MTVDHLKGIDTNVLTLEMAFGRHVVEGDLAKSNVTGTSPNHVVKVQHMLGDTRGKGWSGPEGVWFRGINRPATKFRFHSGLYVPDPTQQTFTASSATDILTCSGHGLSDWDMVLFVPGDLPSPLASGKIYYVRDSTTNTFKVAATFGGGAVNLTTNGTGTLEFYANHDTQGIDPDWQQDHNHSNTAWISVECPNGSEVGIPDENTTDNPPVGFSGIFKCQLGDIYDETGAVTASGQFITNPADVLAFGLKEIRGYANSRINWASLDALRTICDANVSPDFTELPEGVGLTGSYYDGSAFNTLKSVRVDPVLQYDTSTGAPALDITPTSFSVRWEGKIRFKYSGTYTLYLTHNDGGKLWVDNLTTPIVDEWASTGTHSGTFTAVADQFYDIKVEWNNAAGDSQLMLEWQLGTTQARQVIPQDRLYPKNAAQKRFECHVAFTQDTNFDDLLRAVLFNCNGGWHDADGLLKFFCIDELSPSFAFDETNIKKDTFRFYPRYSQAELMNLPNRFIADGRDLDSRYLQRFDPPLYHDLADLQEIAGRIIEETVTVGNTNRWQGLANLRHYAKFRTALMTAEFEGIASTYPVLPGDLVTVTHPLAGWTDKPFLVIEATDKQLPKGGDGADDRVFKVLEWPNDDELK